MAPGVPYGVPPVAMKSRRRITVIACALASVTAGSTVHAQTSDQLRKQLEGIGVVERLGARVPADASFADEQGSGVRLGDYRGKPILLTLNYSQCPVLCSLQLSGLAKGVKDLGDQAGVAFEMVTISIDPTDTPAQLKGAKQVYVRQAGDYSVAERWHFLAGGRDAIAAVTDAVGFRYRLDLDSGEFLHQATLIVLTPDLVVSSYLHGISYTPEDMITAITRASRGEVLTPLEQDDIGDALLNCFAYDPNSPSPKALVAMRVGGAITMAGLFALLIFYIGRERSKRKSTA